MDNSLALGEKIRILRILKKLTLEELSRKSDITLQALRRIEVGKTQPKIGTVTKIAEALDLRAGLLIFFAEQGVRKVNREMVGDDVEVRLEDLWYRATAQR